MTDDISMPPTRQVLRAAVRLQPRRYSASEVKPPSQPHGIDDEAGKHAERAELSQRKAARLDEVGREPGDEEVDDEVQAEEAEHHAPDRAVAEQRRPGDLRAAGWLGAALGLQPRQLLGRHRRVLLRVAIDESSRTPPKRARARR